MQRSIWHFFLSSELVYFCNIDKVMDFPFDIALSYLYTPTCPKVKHLCNPICNFTVNKVALSIRHCGWDWNWNWVFCKKSPMFIPAFPIFPYGNELLLLFCTRDFFSFAQKKGKTDRFLYAYSGYLIIHECGLWLWLFCIELRDERMYE